MNIPEVETNRNSGKKEISPWLDFLRADKPKAIVFLKPMESGEAGAPPVPEGRDLAELMHEKPKRVARLIDLLQVASEGSSAIMERVATVAEQCLQTHLTLDLTESIEGPSLPERVADWIKGRKKRPLSGDDLAWLFVILYWGQLTGMINHDRLVDLLKLAMPIRRKPAKKTKHGRRAEAPREKTREEAILAVGPKAPMLGPLLQLDNIWERQQEQAETEAAAQNRKIRELEEELGRSRSALERLEGALSHEQEMVTELKSEIEKAAEHHTAISNGFRHRISETKARLRGFLEGEASRKLTTALEATRMTPPRVTVIDERLEDVLQAFERELQWLRHSE